MMQQYAISAGKGAAVGAAIGGVLGIFSVYRHAQRATVAHLGMPHLSALDVHDDVVFALNYLADVTRPGGYDEHVRRLAQGLCNMTEYSNRMQSEQMTGGLGFMAAREGGKAMELVAGIEALLKERQADSHVAEHIETIRKFVGDSMHNLTIQTYQ